MACDFLSNHDDVVLYRPDFHGQIGDADARPGRPPERNEAAPVPTVSQVVFIQPSTGAAHPRAHR